MIAKPSRAERIGALLRDSDDDTLVRELDRDTEAIVRSVLGPTDPHRIRTAVHDALLDVVRARRSYRGEGAASTWLYTIARRAALRSIRRESNRLDFESTIDDFEALVGHEAVSGDHGAQMLARELFESAVANPVWREMWLLHNDPALRLSHEEIAARCGRSVGTVAVTLSRVRSLLRHVFEESASGA